MAQHNLQEDLAFSFKNEEENPSSIGELFRKSREKQGISLDYCCQFLKIRKFFLSAIEADNFEDLPAGVYKIKFIQSYGQFLKINSFELEQILKSFDTPTEINSSVAYKREQTYFSPWVLVGSFLLSLIVLVTFLVLRTDFKASPKIVAPLELEESLPLPQLDLNQLSPALITFYALDHTWIRVTNQEEKVLFTKLLSPGEIYQIEKQENLYLTTGKGQDLKVYSGLRVITFPTSSSLSLSSSLYQTSDLLEDIPLN